MTRQALSSWLIRMGLATQTLLSMLCLLTPLIGHADTCKVLDDELLGFFEGGCRNGLADGKGHARGSAEYIGEFREGKKHGYGVKSWSSGDHYEGEFQNDYRHGHGMYVWGDGTKWAGQRYVGEFVLDKREGQGTYFWPTGDRFDGQWKEDLRYGPTVMEQRQLAARKARGQALGRPGTSVCMRVELADGNRSTLKGVTDGLKNNMLRVRITDVDPVGRSLLQQFDSGEIFQFNIWDWTPCLQ